MPAFSYEVTARSDAPPERVFELLADAPSWTRWGGILIGHASWEREGDPPPGGLGAIRKVGNWPTFGHEQIVAYEPPTHHAYTMVRGNPVKNYRADVYLTPDGTGTKITWGATFDPKYPGTGRAITAFYKWFIGALARRLATSAERRLINAVARNCLTPIVRCVHRGSEEAALYLRRAPGPASRDSGDVRMPRISAFYGIVIRMYYDDHNPPHFHAQYERQRAAIAISTREVLRGRLAPRAPTRSGVGNGA